MTLDTNAQLNQVGDPVVIYANTRIETVRMYKYLGVTIAYKLTFSAHVKYLKGEVIGRHKIMSKLRPIMTEISSICQYMITLA